MSQHSIESLAKFISALPALTQWYAQNHRPFPWRKKTKLDPYEIWIVEVMSQQSVMSAVLPYFDRWMKRFPTIESLAEAPLDGVLQMWAGLGYYARARNVHKAAKELSIYKKSHKGHYPQSAKEWLSFSGIGPYTAAAIAAIACNDRALPIDGNIKRVFSRFLGVPDPLNSSQDLATITSFVEQLAQDSRVTRHGLLAQALMELGSQLCKVGAAALCELCPLKRSCFAFAQNQVAAYPHPKIQNKSIRVRRYILAYTNSEGAYLYRRIPPKRPLEGQWELPYFDINEHDKNSEEIFKALAERFELKGPFSHAIMHYRYRCYLIEAGAWKGKAPGSHRFDGLSASKLTLTTSTRKALKLLRFGLDNSQ